MPLTPPTNDDLAAIADRYRLGLGAPDIEAFRGLVTGALASYDTVERLYLATVTDAPVRPCQWPDAAANELGAWYIRTAITGTGAGPLAGRDPRDQGQHRGGRRPDDERVGHRRGLRPPPGRHGRHPPARRRGDHHGQGRLRGPVLLRRQPHLADRPGAQPVGPVPVGGRLVQRQRGPGHGPGQVDLAMGGDQGGSVRIPSAFCGTVGHKPTYGLVPYTGAFPIENTLDHLGPITRTVRDAALMLSVLAGPDGLDPRQS